MTEIERKTAIFLSLFPQVERGEVLRRLGRLGLSRRGVGRALRSLTEQGRVKREEKNGKAYFSPAAPTPEWDGFFRLVFFDVPEESRLVRDQLRRFLKTRGGCLWQRSVWVFWEDIADELVKAFEKKGWEDLTVVLETDRLPGITDRRELAARIWKLDSLTKRYEDVLRLWREGYEEVQDDADALTALIRRLTQKFLAAAVGDPLLPPQLLPKGWVGTEVFRLMTTLQKAPI